MDEKFNKKEIFFSHARTAFKFGLLNVKISENDTILVPDYNCDVILHSLFDLKIKPIYYKINDDFSIDIENLKNSINKNTKALLIVHYFGKTQNLKKISEFCTQNNLYLIEDNAHGFGSKVNGKLVGTFGDFGFSSPRKFLPIISGGIFIL